MNGGRPASKNIIRRRANQMVSRTTSRLAQHPIALGLVVAAIGGFLAYIAWVSVNGPPFQDRYKLDAIVASDSPVLKPGGQVREAGKLAGTITDVAPEGENLRVSMELRPEFAPVGEDATAAVRVRSIVYLTYVEINPGDRDNERPDGSTIPLAQTGSGTDLLEVVQLFDEKTREELRSSLVNTGQGVAGRGEGLNASLGDLDETLQRGTPQLRALTRDPGAIATSIQGTARVSDALTGQQPDDVGALVDSGAAALGAVANEEAALGQAVENLRPFEDEFLRVAPLANPVLEDVGSLASELSPAANKFTKGLPDVNRLLSLGNPLRKESAKLADLFIPVLELTGPQIYNLYPAAVALDPIIAALKTTVGILEPYTNDIALAGKGVASATSVSYPEGQTAPNNKVLRYIPVLSCHRSRNPYPAPGEALKDSASC